MRDEDMDREARHPEARGSEGSDDLAAWLRLLLTPGLGPPVQRRLLAVFGLPQEVFAAPTTALAGEAAALSPAQIRALRHPPARLDSLVEALGMPRKHRDNSMAGWPLEERLPVGALGVVNTGALLGAFEREIGLPSDSPVYSLLEQARYHTPPIRQPLLEMVAEGERRGDLPLSFLAGLELPPIHQFHHFWGEVGEMWDLAIALPLTPTQCADPQQCAIITSGRCVLSGPLKATAVEKEAMDKGDLAGVAAVAKARGAATVRQPATCAGAGQRPRVV